MLFEPGWVGSKPRVTVRVGCLARRQNGRKHRFNITIVVCGAQCHLIATTSSCKLFVFKLFLKACKLQILARFRGTKARTRINQTRRFVGSKQHTLHFKLRLWQIGVKIGVVRLNTMDELLRYATTAQKALGTERVILVTITHFPVHIVQHAYLTPKVHVFRVVYLGKVAHKALKRFTMDNVKLLLIVLFEQVKGLFTGKIRLQLSAHFSPCANSCCKLAVVWVQFQPIAVCQPVYQCLAS